MIKKIFNILTKTKKKSPKNSPKKSPKNSPKTKKTVHINTDKNTITIMKPKKTKDMDKMHGINYSKITKKCPKIPRKRNQYIDFPCSKGTIYFHTYADWLEHANQLETLYDSPSEKSMTTKKNTKKHKTPKNIVINYLKTQNLFNEK